MRLIRRPLVPGEPDPELLWGSVSGALALIAAGWLRSGLPTPLCPLHALTGIPCPTCGTTRAATALLHGDITGALTLNPLMTGAIIAAALCFPYTAFVVIGKMPRLRWTAPTRSEARWIRISAITLIAANWAYLLWRGV